MLSHHSTSDIWIFYSFGGCGSHSIHLSDPKKIRVIICIFKKVELEKSIVDSLLFIIKSMLNVKVFPSPMNQGHSEKREEKKRTDTQNIGPHILMIVLMLFQFIIYLFIISMNTGTGYAIWTIHHLDNIQHSYTLTRKKTFLTMISFIIIIIVYHNRTDQPI